MISPYRIKYNNYINEDFDVICDLAFDSDSGEISSYLSRDAVASDTYNGSYKRVYSYKWNEVLQPKITLIDKDFGDFTLERQRAILRWLTSKSTPSFLTIYEDESETVMMEILGGFIDVKPYKLSNNRTVGYVCTFESVCPWAFSPLYTYTQNVSNPSTNKFTININTDDIESPVYPRITIKQNNSVIVNVDYPMIVNGAWVNSDYVDGTVYYYANTGDYYYNKHNTDGSIVATITKNNPVTTDTKTSVIIKNVHTDEDSGTHINNFCIKNNTAGETIVMDGANKVISSSATKRVMSNDFDWNWMPLYNGKNDITVIGNCIVELQWRSIRKVGEY